MWTDDRTELLKKLWANGLSATQIATKIGEVTRSAVLGKVWRMGLESRGPASRIRKARPRNCIPVHSLTSIDRRTPKPGTHARPARRTTPWQARRKPTLPPLEAAPEGLVTMETLTEASCRWPEGDPKRPGFHFCGRRRAAGVPYCAHHAAIAYNPAAASSLKNRLARIVAAGGCEGSQ